MHSYPISTGRKIWIAWTWITDGLLCLLLVAMILLACTQITLRTFFSGGFLWAEPLLRYLVLWSGLLGAVVATREGKHIAIDVVTYLAPEKIRQWIRLVLNVFACSTAVILTWAAITFIRNEMQFGSTNLLNTPSWVWNLIFPIAFGLIAFHFFIGLLENILQIFGSRISQATRQGTGPDDQ